MMNGDQERNETINYFDIYNYEGGWQIKEIKEKMREEEGWGMNRGRETSFQDTIIYSYLVSKTNSDHIVQKI